jgi:hypothetical protein
MYIVGHDRVTLTQNASLNSITMATVIILSDKARNILPANDNGTKGNAYKTFINVIL